MKSFRLRTLFILVTVMAICCAAVKWFDVLGPTGELFRLERISHNDASSVAYATSKLQSQELRVRNASLLALGRVGPPAKSSMPELLKILAADSPAEAPNAAWAIGWIGPTNPSVSTALRDALKSKNAETRRYAAYAVSLHKGAATPIPELIALLDDERVAYVAARALGEMGPAGTVAVPKLISLLAVDNGAKAEAAIALSHLSAFTPLPSDAMGMIEELTTDSEEYVRNAATRALSAIEFYRVEATTLNSVQ